MSGAAMTARQVCVGRNTYIRCEEQTGRCMTEAYYLVILVITRPSGPAVLLVMSRFS